MCWLELLGAFIAGGLAHMILQAVLLRRVTRKDNQRALAASFGSFGGKPMTQVHLDAKMRRQFGVGDGH